MRPGFRLHHQVHHGRPFLRIVERRHIAARLVQQVVAPHLRPLQQLAIHPDVVARGVVLRPQLGDHLAVDLHPPGQNDLLGLPPARNPRRRQNLL